MNTNIIYHENEFERLPCWPANFIDLANLFVCRIEIFRTIDIDTETINDSRIITAVIKAWSMFYKKNIRVGRFPVGGYIPLEKVYC